jgi:hypothetical protein
VSLPSRREGVEAGVSMRRHEGGWRVEIQERTPHRPGWRAYAATEAHDIDTALRMAVPYLAVLSEPDPFAHLLDAGPPPIGFQPGNDNDEREDR